MEIANIGIYDGVKSIRRAPERDGSAGLKHGQLYDHLQLDMTVSIEPGVIVARARGLEFGILGEADKGEAFMSLSVFENRYVKQNDIWRIHEMRIFPVWKTDYDLGWVRSRVVDPVPDLEFAPDRAVPSSDVMAVGAIPAFFSPNPGTGKPVSYPPGTRGLAEDHLLHVPLVLKWLGFLISPTVTDERIAEAERKLAVSKAYDGTENISIKRRGAILL